jgi:hypothetical protein
MSLQLRTTGPTGRQGRLRERPPLRPSSEVARVPITFAVDDVVPASSPLPTRPLRELAPDALFVGGIRTPP